MRADWLPWFLAVFAATSAEARVASVWAASDGDKVDRDDLASSLKAGNSVWDGKRVRVAAARNEVVAFQVIVETDGEGVRELRAALPELAKGRSRIRYAPPPSADPTTTVGRPIQIFTVGYLHVEQPTRAGWIYRLGTPSAPQNPTGWKPVQLIPENARPGRGGFPLSIPARTGQAIWLEIYTARDLEPGVYRGTVEITADGRSTRLPIELEVFDFTLPDENSMHAMMYFERDQPELYQGRRMDAEYHRFAHRHRVEFVHAYNEETVTSDMARFDGSAFTRGSGYEGPGANTGNRVVPRTFYGPQNFTTKEVAWPQSDRWIEFLSARLPKALTFLYLPDEPYPKQYPQVRALADMLHANPGPGRKLRTFLTHEYVDALDGVADIWCSGPRGFRIDRVNQERAKGRDYWIYNGGRPAGGAIVIDAPATDARALIWGCFKHDIAVYFYWHVNHWRHNSQKPKDRVQNVWANPITFDNRGQPNKPVEDQSFANGDGVLVYPGQDVIHRDQDRGIAGPIGTLQLANFRRGLQDHQYLTLARRCGAADVVSEALSAVVPRMFSDAGNTVGFSESAGDYERARLQLAKAIAACKPALR